MTDSNPLHQTTDLMRIPPEPLALLIERRITEQFAQHEDIYMREASELDRNRLWRLRDTVLRVVDEEIANERPAT